MNNKFYLVQRGIINKDLSKVKSFLNGRPDALVDPEYMGSAEFEWGAIPRAYFRMQHELDKYSLHITDLKTLTGVPFVIFCRDEFYEEVLESIKQYIENPWRTKEWTNLEDQFKKPTSTWDKPFTIHTNFWWCIDKNDPADHTGTYDSHVGDWIAFTGATDRQHKFMEIINEDHKSHDDMWSKLTDQERKDKINKCYHGW